MIGPATDPVVSGPRTSADARRLARDAIAWKIDGKRRPLDCASLAGCITAFATREFGLCAGLVLREVGLRTARDVGAVILDLIDEGALTRQPSDDFACFDTDHDVSRFADVVAREALAMRLAPERRRDCARDTDA